MNYSIIRYILCRVLEFQAMFLVLPCLAAIIFREKEGIAYFVVFAACLLLGAAGKLKNQKVQYFMREKGLWQFP